jgi:hypothetical protein
MTEDFLRSSYTDNQDCWWKKSATEPIAAEQAQRQNQYLWAPDKKNKYRVPQKKLYNFESLYKFIHRTCSVLWTSIM